MKIAFSIYFTIIQAFGLLAAAFGDGQLSLLGPEVMLCFPERQADNRPAAAGSHHRHGRDGHSHHHSTGSVPETRPAPDPSDSPQIPFIHCSPIAAHSISSDLTLPSELPEPAVRSQVLPSGPRLRLAVPHGSSRDIQPATPPPRDPGLQG